MPAADVIVSGSCGNTQSENINTRRSMVLGVGFVIALMAGIGVILNLLDRPEEEPLPTVPGGRPQQAQAGTFTVPDYTTWPNPDGKYDEAFAYIAADPYDTQAYYDLGYSYYIDGEYESARLAMETVNGIDPGWYWANLNLVLIDLNTGQQEQGLARLRELAELEQGDAYCQNNTGLLLIDQGLYELAVRCINRAVGLEPEIPEYHYNLAIAYLNQDRNDEGERELAQAMVLSRPGDETYEKAKQLIGQL